MKKESITFGKLLLYIQNNNIIYINKKNKLEN